MDLGLRGKRLQTLQLEHTLVLQLCDVHVIAVSSPLSFELDGERTFLSPEEDSEAAFAPIRELTGQAVDAAVADSTGALEVTFEGGAILRVEPDPAYEAWNVSGPDGQLVVSTPGGELAIWGARPKGED